MAVAALDFFVTAPGRPWCGGPVPSTVRGTGGLEKVLIGTRGPRGAFLRVVKGRAAKTSVLASGAKLTRACLPCTVNGNGHGPRRAAAAWWAGPGEVSSPAAQGPGLVPFRQKNKNDRTHELAKTFLKKEGCLPPAYLPVVSDSPRGW